LAVLVTQDGAVHEFSGRSIPGVCHAIEVAYEKNGKWSASTYDVLHSDTTSFVAWVCDWDTGKAWPQATACEGFAWLAERAPAVTRQGFDAFILRAYPEVSERWAERAKAEEEFGGASTPPPIVVTRHPGLVEVLREIGAVGLEVSVVAHASAADVTGRRVIGVLPLSLAALAENITEVVLDLPAEMRGVELSADQVRKYMVGTRTYVVRTAR
jgi:hypothetical protein